jgi:GDP-D-mannose dehydratase
MDELRDWGRAKNFVRMDWMMLQRGMVGSAIVSQLESCDNIEIIT